jgi:hypothetical protein
MSRHSEALTEANEGCLDEFYSTLNTWLHQRDQEDRQAMDQDESLIRKQEVISASQNSQ